ncbi:hypothetical protein Bpfe_016350, partial [Biomphalaria pfeifferi]
QTFNAEVRIESSEKCRRFVWLVFETVAVVLTVVAVAVVVRQHPNGRQNRPSIQRHRHAIHTQVSVHKETPSI